MADPAEEHRKNKREFLIAMAAFVALVIIAFILVAYFF